MMGRKSGWLSLITLAVECSVGANSKSQSDSKIAPTYRTAKLLLLSRYTANRDPSIAPLD
jgi:hypothetical protein